MPGPRQSTNQLSQQKRKEIAWLNTFIRLLLEDRKIVNHLPVILGGQQECLETFNSDALISEIMLHLKIYEEKMRGIHLDLDNEYDDLNITSANELKSSVRFLIEYTLNPRKLCLLDCNMVSRFDTIKRLMKKGYDLLFSKESLLEVNAWDTKKEPIGSPRYHQNKPKRQAARKKIAQWIKDSLSLYHNDIPSIYNTFKNKKSLHEKDRTWLNEHVAQHLKVPLLFFLIEHRPELCMFGNKILFRDEYNQFVESKIDDDFTADEHLNIGMCQSEIFTYIRTAAIRSMVNHHKRLFLTFDTFHWQESLKKIIDAVTFDKIQQFEQSLDVIHQQRKEVRKNFVEKYHEQGNKHHFKSINELSLSDMKTFNAFFDFVDKQEWVDEQEWVEPSKITKKANSGKIKVVLQKYIKLHEIWSDNRENMPKSFKDMMQQAKRDVEKKISQGDMKDLLEIDLNVQKPLSLVVKHLLMPDVIKAKKKIHQMVKKTLGYRRLPSDEAVMLCRRSLQEALKSWGHPRPEREEDVVANFKEGLKLIRPSDHDAKVIDGVSDKFDVNDFSMLLLANVSGADVVTANRSIQDQAFINWAIAYCVHNVTIAIDYENTDIEGSLHDEQNDINLSWSSKQKCAPFSPERRNRKIKKKSATPNSHRKVSGNIRRFSPHGTPPRREVSKNRRSKPSKAKF